MKLYSLLFALIVAIVGLAAVVNARPTESQTTKTLIVQHRDDPCDSGRTRAIQTACRDPENPAVLCQMVFVLCAAEGDDYKLTMVQD